MMDGGSQHGWGNHLGYLIINIPLKHHQDSLDYVRAAKKITDRKKASLEGVFTYWSGAMLMGLTGPKVNFSCQFLVRLLHYFWLMVPPTLIDKCLHKMNIFTSYIYKSSST